jgi:glycosyltransferase involved in cell wall biosynthesis
MEPFLSVITVTLNPGAALRATVASVQVQTFPGIEHIIKDGGSTDGGLAFLSKLHYGATGPRRLQVCADKGIYDAMNQALAQARGEYVCFLNGGDVLRAPDVLGRIHDAIVPTRPDLLYTDYEFGPDRIYGRSPPRLSRHLLFRKNVNQQCCFYRRDAFTRWGGFDTAFRILADYEFLARLVVTHHGACRHLPLRAIHYQWGGVSESRAQQAQVRRELHALRRRYFTPLEYSVLLTLWTLTMPRLRMRLSRSPRWTKWYYRIIRAIQP